MASFLEIASNIFNPFVLLLMLAGVVVGITFGAIPGLNTPIAVALMLPFCFALDTVPSISLLMGVYMGGISGGLVSAILLRIPGTAAAVTTTFDGYPMTQKGLAAEALSLGTFASLVGGLFSAVALWLISPALTNLALKFGPWEYFGITFFALSLVSVLMDKSIVKGYISVFIGLFFSCIGISSMDSIVKRFTFGNYHLDAGLSTIVVIIGIYALPEVLSAAGKLKEDLKPATFTKKWIYVPEWNIIKANAGNFLRSSIIGTFIGILPGMGSSTAGMLSYAQARKFSKTPEQFGNGSEEGVIASETANNAVTGGALVPMLALGVPGDSVSAIIMSALVIQGISVGPMFLTTQPVLFQTIILAVFVANIFMFLVQSTGIRFFAKIVQVPRYYLMPLIAVFCAIGVISANNTPFNVYMILILGVVGYILEKNHYPLPPLLLGFVLGSLCEQYYRRSMMYYGGFMGAMAEKSVGSLLVILAFLFPIGGILLSSEKIRRFLHLKDKSTAK